MPILSLQSNWGGEYRPFTSYLESIGITHRLFCLRTHEQNGHVELKHRHILEIALTLLANASMPLRFWDEAVKTSVHLINHLPTPILSHKSLFEVLFNRKPDYKSLKVFDMLLLS